MMKRVLLSLNCMVLSLFTAIADTHAGDSLALTSLEAPVDEMMYHLRFVPEKHNPIAVSMYWNYTDPSDHYRADFEIAPIDDVDNTDCVPIDCKISRVRGASDSIVGSYSSYVKYGRGRDAAVSAILRVNEAGARLDFGGKTVDCGFDVPYNDAVGAVGFKTDRKATVLTNNLLSRYCHARMKYDGEIVFDDDDPLTGKWEYLDRDADRDKVASAIDYQIAVVAEPDSTYTIIYAGEPADGWNRGDIKGRLMPTDFENHFDLEWYDQSGRLYRRDTSADLLVEGRVLRFNFPILGTTVRFRRF